MTRLSAPLRVGALELPNRVVMAPLGRARADAGGDAGYLDYPFLSARNQ